MFLEKQKKKQNKKRKEKNLKVGKLKNSDKTKI
jgi:hypothetical protein